MPTVPLVPPFRWEQADHLHVGKLPGCSSFSLTTDAPTLAGHTLPRYYLDANHQLLGHVQPVHPEEPTARWVWSVNSVAHSDKPRGGARDEQEAKACIEMYVEEVQRARALRAKTRGG